MYEAGSCADVRPSFPASSLQHLIRNSSSKSLRCSSRHRFPCPASCPLPFHLTFSSLHCLIVHDSQTISRREFHVSLSLSLLCDPGSYSWHKHVLLCMSVVCCHRRCRYNEPSLQTHSFPWRRRRRRRRRRRWNRTEREREGREGKSDRFAACHMPRGMQRRRHRRTGSQACSSVFCSSVRDARSTALLATALSLSLLS